MFLSFYLDFLSLKLILGFSVVLLILSYNLEKKLDNRQYKIFIFVIFFFPIIETSLKIFNKYYIPQEFNTLNYIACCNEFEHLLAGIAIGVILLPFIVDILRKLNKKEQIILFVPLVSFFCLSYELIGYYFFYTNKPYLALLYQDTMQDLTMNIIGALIAFILLMGFKKGNKNKIDK